MSLSYELSGRNNYHLSSNDMGSIIGKNAIGLKKIISNSWGMYERLQSSEKKVDETKPTLRIILKDHENGINVEITSDSESMQKLAQLSLDKYIEFLQKQKFNKPHEFIGEFPHRLLGKIIGKKASGIKNIIDEMIKKVEEGMSENDLTIAKTTRIKVNEIDIQSDNCEQIIDFQNQKYYRSFIGWSPNKEDEYKEHISMFVSFRKDTNLFQDREEFIRLLECSIVNRISYLVDEDQDTIDEINELLGL